MKREQEKEEANESQNNFAKLMNMYTDDAQQLIQINKYIFIF